MSLHAENHYRHCPTCGGLLERREIKVEDPPRLVCVDCGFIYYENPKIAAAVIVMHQGKLVLLKRAIEPAKGKWVFPGGYVDLGEIVGEAAVREAKEEACIDVEIESLLNVYSYPGRPVVIVVYTGRIIAGEPGAGDECLECRLFALDEIPWDDLAFPSTREALKDYLSWQKGS